MTSGFGISVLVPQTSFHGETVGGIAKCWLFFFFFFGQAFSGYWA